MNALDSRIKELVAYARERDGEDRTALFRNLVDLFLTDNAPTKQPTRAQLLDVVNALIPHVEPESRKTVSDLLASMSNPPMDLVHYIVRDRASIVSKLLKEAPFDEDQLIELVETTGREHHQELAGRNDLSANVWIALARATPAAPPYGSKSTLALWKEDLGLSDGFLSNSDPQDEDKPSASITSLHGTSYRKSNAKLRILKIDEDIVSSHVENERNHPDNITFVGEDADAGDANPIDRIPEETHPEPQVKVNIAHEDLDDIQETVPSDAKNQDIEDTGEWHWVSDRDGFIVKASEHAPTMENGDNIVGSTMLDMLSLNSKLGHPVSRAFQRRSQIHDAPIYLSHLGQNQRYWHLNAEPAFEAGSGKFEGYHGTMCPIVPSQEPADIIPADEPSNEAAIELKQSPPPEISTSVADGEPAVGGSTIDRPNPLKDRASWLDTRSSEEPLAPKATVTAEVKEPTEDASDLDECAADVETDTTVPRTSGGDVARILERAFTESFDTGKSDTDRAEADLPASEDVKEDVKMVEPDTTAAAEDIEDAALTPKETSDQAEGVDTIPATIELLEEALSRLANAERNGNALQIRLQAEIAQACVRTLKSELSKK
jgi:hypothetical protein